MKYLKVQNFKKETVFKRTLKKVDINNMENIKKPMNFIESSRDYIITKTSNLYKQETNLKINLKFNCNYTRQNDIQEFIFKSKTISLSRSTDLINFSVIQLVNYKKK